MKRDSAQNGRPKAGSDYSSVLAVDELHFSVSPCRWYGYKRTTERTAAALLLLPGLPIIGVLVALVRLSSSGPGIYRQRRVGKHGRVYWMYKIRTMRNDAEAKSGAVWCQPGDPRVTRLGSWLRRLHLDEFPQLFNVIKGEMTLIGPRPERPEFVPVLADEIPAYVDRLAVEPGITGLAQINLPPDTDLDSVRRKLLLDREYIEDSNPWLDLRIVCCTLTRLLGVPGESAMRLFRLNRSVCLTKDLPPEDTSLVAVPAGGVDGNGSGKSEGDMPLPVSTKSARSVGAEKS